MPKEICHLTKRRINQLISIKIDELKHSARSATSIIHTHNSTSLDHSQHQKTVINQQCNFNHYNSENESHSIQSSESIHHALQYDNIDTNHETFDEVTLLYADSENHFNTPPVEEISFSDGLKIWILEHKVSHRSVNDLLGLLRKNGHEDLPKDVRTLMNTPRTATNAICHDNGGAYMHFGIANGLKRSIKRYYEVPPVTIGVQINCDGLSLSNSSSSQFWPILMAIDADFYTEPFIVGIFHGYSKPVSPNIFLTAFVIDMLTLEKEGLVIDNQKIEVNIHVITCDAPAKAYITCTKYPTGYSSCSKCVQEGEWQGRVVFPDIESPVRTNESFNNMDDEEHHSGTSVLKHLKIGMVSHIALDYMHLVCLGVVKRLVQLWTKGPRNIRLSPTKIADGSAALLAMRSSIPSEFARQPRNLETIDKWKATECRQFLLYTGPIVLQNILSEEYYIHFLTLSIAIRILCDPRFCVNLNSYANSLLKWFVENYKNLYGIEYLTHNVHNLLHLAHEVKVFGCLDKFSCFKFENFMSNIKNKVQNAPKPLEQVVNRTLEENSLPIIRGCKKFYPIVQYVGNSSEIKALEFNGFILTKKKTRSLLPSNNDHCLLRDLSVLMITDFSIIGNDVYITGDKYMEKKNFATIPCDFSVFNIYKFDNSCPVELVTVKATEVLSKCVKLTYPLLDYKLVIPLLQCNN